MERKKYRNVLNQPLSVGLDSDSFSVPPKGYIDVEFGDFGSVELKRLVRVGMLVLVETVINVEILDDVEKGVDLDVALLESVSIEHRDDTQSAHDGDKVDGDGEDTLTFEPIKESNGGMDGLMAEVESGGVRDGMTRRKKLSKGKKK